MVLMEKDGITVQAMDEREVAHWKRLGYKVVEPAKPAKKQAEQPADKDGE